MTLRITASYPATDGTSPESIEVIWEDEARQPTSTEIVAAVEALARVPSIARAEHREDGTQP